MNTPGTALIVVLLVDGSRLAFEFPEEGRWFDEAMRAAGLRLSMRGVVPRAMVVMSSKEVHQYGASEVFELTGCRFPVGRVEVTSRDYERSHQKAPRGRGSWAFRVWMPGGNAQPGYWREDLFWSIGLYSEAKAAAVAFARSVGATRVDAQA